MYSSMTLTIAQCTLDKEAYLGKLLCLSQQSPCVCWVYGAREKFVRVAQGLFQVYCTNQRLARTTSLCLKVFDRYNRSSPVTDHGMKQFSWYLAYIGHRFNWTLYLVNSTCYVLAHACNELRTEKLLMIVNIYKTSARIFENIQNIQLLKKLAYDARGRDHSTLKANLV